MPIHLDRLSEDVLSSPETPNPIGMGQHRDKVPTDDAVVLVGEQAADRGLELQDREVASRDEHAVGSESLSFERQVGLKGSMRRDTSEGLLLRLEVPEHRVAEDVVAASSLVTRLRARLGTGCAEVHELVGPRDWERLQEHLIEQGENRRVRTDAQSE